jgi:galactokinase
MPVLGELVCGGDRLLVQSARLLAENLGVGRSRRVIAVYVPGRVEFLGKHTDYAGGRSLLMAVERGFRLLAAPREDGALHVTTGDGQDVQ